MDSYYSSDSNPDFIFKSTPQSYWTEEGINKWLDQVIQHNKDNPNDGPFEDYAAYGDDFLEDPFEEPAYFQGRPHEIPLSDYPSQHSVAIHTRNEINQRSEVQAGHYCVGCGFPYYEDPDLDQDVSDYQSFALDRDLDLDMAVLHKNFESFENIVLSESVQARIEADRRDEMMIMRRRRRFWISVMFAVAVLLVLFVIVDVMLSGWFIYGEAEMLLNEAKKRMIVQAVMEGQRGGTMEVDWIRREFGGEGAKPIDEDVD